jgi:hypothetical protein
VQAGTLAFVHQEPETGTPRSCNRGQIVAAEEVSHGQHSQDASEN